MMTHYPLLEIKDLSIGFHTDSGMISVVDHLNLTLPAGKCIGLVGESGSGKSVTAQAIMRLLPYPMGHIQQGEIHFQGKNILTLSDKELYALRGQHISMIFQEHSSALNPVHTIGKQIAEVLMLHSSANKQEIMDQILTLMEKVQIPSPQQTFHAYPHQLSGGLRQRVMIAIAIACSPALVIADEPTTALDVTTQSEILHLLTKLQQENKATTLLISHDLPLIAQQCDTIAVMYAGRIVEYATTEELFTHPRHAYTRGLLSSTLTDTLPPRSVLPFIPGQPIPPAQLVTGCRFCQRLGRDIQELTTRPDYREITPHHWVELCPHCASELPPT